MKYCSAISSMATSLSPRASVLLWAMMSRGISLLAARMPPVTAASSKPIEKLMSSQRVAALFSWSRKTRFVCYCCCSCCYFFLDKAWRESSAVSGEGEMLLVGIAMLTVLVLLLSRYSFLVVCEAVLRQKASGGAIKFAFIGFKFTISQRTPGASGYRYIPVPPIASAVPAVLGTSCAIPPG